MKLSYPRGALGIIVIFVAMFCMWLFLCSDVSAMDVATFEELSAALENGDADITLTNDLEFSSLLTVSADTAIKGAGKQLKRAQGYRGGLFSIKAGGKLDLENIIIDGGASGWSMDYENRVYTKPETNSGYIRVPTINGSDDIIAKSSLITNVGSLSFKNVTVQNARLAQKGASNANIYGSVISGKGNNTIANSTIKHNGGYNTGGAFYVTGGTTIIKDSVIEGNVSGVGNMNSVSGGFLYMADGDLTIEGSEFKDNYAQTNGGVGYVLKSNVKVSDSRFDHNMVGNDGSAFAFQSKVEGKYLTVESSIFENNIGYAVTGQSMGTIWQETWYSTADSNQIVYRDLVFRNNTVSTGAAISDLSRSSTYILMENIEVFENKTYAGGVLYNQGGNYTIRNLNCHDNNGSNGVGLYNLSGSVTIENSKITDNVATGSGAGVYTASGNVTIIDSEITGNSSDARGGGIFVRGRYDGENPSLTIVNTVIKDNSAVTMGGGIAVADNEDIFSSISIDDKSKIYDNHAENMADDFSYERQNNSDNNSDNAITLDNISIAGINGIDGWYHDNEGDRFKDTDNPIVFVDYVDNSGKISLYLKAAGISTGDYDGNGGDTDAKPIRVKYGDTYIVDDDVPARDGYDFIGWNTKPDGSGINLSAGDVYDGSDGWTLYAQWRAKAINPATNDNTSYYFGAFAIVAICVSCGLFYCIKRR